MAAARKKKDDANGLIAEIATAIILTVILALGLGWFPTKSAMIQGFDIRQHWIDQCEFVRAVKYPEC